jgi:tetratricopeptide (TPR) repeat protein
MLKDDKNIDYKDQIYYALAEIAIKENNEDLAKKHLLNSTASNLGNDQQQSISHLTLANIYFDEASYLYAQGHYDTAMTFLSENHPNYEMLSKKRNSLNDLVSLYNTITLQDSLMTLSLLDEDALLEMIDQLIEDKKEEDRQAKAALKAGSGGRQNTNSRNQFNPMAGGGGAWYFYNPSAVSFGYSEFITKWGERKLEDNWRRKNKQQISFDDDDDDEEKDIYSREYYLDIIPVSDSAKLATVDLIVQSFYQLGLIYKEELQDYPEALDVFETLLSAYPKNKYEALSYYQLYTTHKLLDENLPAQSYFEKLQKEYPESDYLKMIMDPESYYSQNTDEVDSAMYYYENVYTLFVNSEYSEVIDLADSLRAKYKLHPIAEQCYLLNALSTGHLFGEEKLMTSLNELLTVYSSGEVADEARAILQDIERRSIISDETLYTFDEDEEHYYILAIETTGPSINKLKMAVSDFNTKFYEREMYKTQSLMLNLYYQLIIVKTFDKSSRSLKYLDAIKEDESLKSILGRSDFEHFIISSSNFKTFYKDKSLDQYLVYFEGTYLKYK